MSKAESGNGDFMGLPPLGKPLKRLYVWGGDCGFVLVERMDKEDLTTRDVRKVAHAMVDMVVAAEKAQKVNAVKKALMQGRVGDVLTKWERHHLRRVGEGESLSRWKADKLVEIGLITEDGKHLTHDGELALKQINSTPQ